MGSYWVNEMGLFYVLFEKILGKGILVKVSVHGCVKWVCVCVYVRRVSVNVWKCMNIDADMSLMCRQDLGEVTNRLKCCWFILPVLQRIFDREHL